MKSRILMMVSVAAIAASAATAKAQPRLKRFQERLDEIKSMFEDDDQGEEKDNAKRSDALPTPASALMPNSRGLPATNMASIGARLQPSPDGRGLIVLSIQQNGEAHRAGLQNGDRILSVGEFPTNRLEDWQEVQKSVRPGDHIEVDIWRDNQSGKAVIGFGTSPLPGSAQGNIPPSRQPNYGQPSYSQQPFAQQPYLPDFRNIGSGLITAPGPPDFESQVARPDSAEPADDDETRRPFSVLHKLTDQLQFQRPSRPAANPSATPQQIDQMRQTIQQQQQIIYQLQQEIRSLRSGGARPVELEDPALAPPHFN